MSVILIIAGVLLLVMMLGLCWIVANEARERQLAEKKMDKIVMQSQKGGDNDDVSKYINQPLAFEYNLNERNQSTTPDTRPISTIPVVSKALSCPINTTINVAGALYDIDLLSNEVCDTPANRDAVKKLPKLTSKLKLVYCGSNYAPRDVSAFIAARCDGKNTCNLDFMELPPPSSAARNIPRGCEPNDDNEYCKIARGTIVRGLFTCVPS